ncbi:MAG: alkaline phosphatase D family protein [Gemmatimonadetes bacterium]|nr:alkaline phosphatase D family protein [Candidatus Palauibacter australiensis]
MTTRRDFLAAWSRSAALCALAPLPFAQFGPVARANGGGIRVSGGGSASVDRFPFELGVASGEPAADGVVLWTRLLALPGDPGAAFPVRWEIAADDGFRSVVRRGEAAALAELGHSVHVEVEGLEPGRDYWYRFHAAGATSPVGRTRTAPAPGALPDRLDFVFVSCQHYERGWYTGFRHMAAESPALVVHLGDYIYESGPGAGDNLVRRHDTEEPRTLDGYRARYALYKRDPDLQAAHAAAPWVFTPDDHEVDNDWAGDHNTEDMTQEAFLARRAAAFQAMYEHFPLRRTSLPAGPDAQLHRRLDFGSLMRLHVLDTRQYRTLQPCGGRRQPPCAEQRAEGATILGTRQADWLLDGLDSSPARYNVLANQVFMARLLEGDETLTLPMDKWDGYPADRDRLMTFLHERRPSNPVVLTGDLHTNWVNDLKLDFERADSPTVGTEFAGTSISSSGDGVDMAPQGENAMGHNPHIKFFNAQRGYVRCRLSPARLRTDFRVMPYVTRPDAPIATRASYVVENGTPGARET